MIDWLAIAGLCLSAIFVGFIHFWHKRQIWTAILASALSFAVLLIGAGIIIAVEQRAASYFGTSAFGAVGVYLLAVIALFWFWMLRRARG
jgi:hypothetical protein